MGGVPATAADAADGSKGWLGGSPTNPAGRTKGGVTLVDRGGINVDMEGTAPGGVGAVPSKNPVVGVEENDVPESGPGDTRPSRTPRWLLAGDEGGTLPFKLGIWLL